MDSVLDFLFLRRLKFEYTSPPICPITPASASGTGITGQVISPILQMPAPTVFAQAFLAWQCQPGDVCYNIYQNINNSFTEVTQCVQPETITFCSAACWTVNPVLNGVDQPGIGPFCIDGTKPFTTLLPPGTQFRVYKNGNLVLDGVFCVAIETCAPACYSVTRITSDGESPVSPSSCTQPNVPSIVITTPVDGTTEAPNTSTPIVAMVTLNGNTADSVQFYDNGIALGSPINAPGPYTLTTTPSLGQHVYTAVLTYNGNQTATSNVVHLLVQDSLHDVAAYWQFDGITSGKNWLDSIGTQTLVDQALDGAHQATIVSPGLIVNAARELDVGPLSIQALQAPDSAILGIGPGVSFTLSTWVRVQVPGSQNLTGGRPIIAKGKNTGLAPDVDYILHHDNFVAGVTLTVTQSDGLSAVNVNYNATDPLSTPPSGWHHIVCGYDDTNKQIFIQFDNSARITNACNGVQRTANGFTVFNFSDLGFRGLFDIDETGLWKRVLTTTEVTRLYNGGAGYALNHFYP